MSEAADNVPVFIHIAAGCIAGGIETTATWPMEYIKTLLQLQRPPRPKSLEYDEQMLDEEEQSDTSQSFTYIGVVSGVMHTVRAHGFSTLYLGLMPTLLGSIPKAGLRFGLFAWFSELMKDADGHLSLPSRFLAGLAAGVVEALVIVVPVETIKTKCIQLKLSFLEGLMQILLAEGIGGIYHGVFATVLKQSSNHGLRFVWYYEFKRIVSHDGMYPLTPWQSFLGGMTAGIFSCFGNQPFDVLKTRMQGVRAEYSSTWECIYQTFRTEGIAGFYKGIIARLARVIPGQGITFMSYELIITILMTFFHQA